MNNAKNTSVKSVLFSIYDYKGTVVRDVYGPTNEKLNKTKPVNCCIAGAFYILQEESRRIGHIKSQYSRRKGITEISEFIKKIKKETNWKLRVLNEQLKEKIKESKIIEETMKAAQALIKLSKSAERIATRKANKEKREGQQPVRRSSRIAIIEMEKQKKHCRGCREEQPNQLAHVGPGGCLGEEEF